MKRIMLISGTVLLAMTLLAACSLFATKSTVTFNLTDAPIDSASVTAVTMTIESVAVHTNVDAASDSSGWQTLALDPVQTIDVLDLQGGLVQELGNLALPGGTKITQIRLGVTKVEITKDGTTYEASMPGGTEFKLVGAFDVPLSGGVTITIDFDARKSIVQTGNNAYRVKPTIRAIVEDQAGAITGTATAGQVIYAYADGTWTTDQTTANTDGIAFAAAYSSTIVDSAGTYKLAFLAPGTYDLVAVTPATATVSAEIADIVVTAGKTSSAVNF